MAPYPGKVEHTYQGLNNADVWLSQVYSNKPVFQDTHVLDCAISTVRSGVNMVGITLPSVILPTPLMKGSPIGDGTGSFGTSARYNTDSGRVWIVYGGIITILGNESPNSASVKEQRERLSRWIRYSVS